MSDLLKVELLCDVWAGFIIFEPIARAFKASRRPREEFGHIFVNVMSQWKDLGDDAKLAKRLHGAGVTRGLLFGAGFTGRSEYDPSYGIKSIEIVAFDDEGSLLMWFVDKSGGYFMRFHL